MRKEKPYVVAFGAACIDEYYETAEWPCAGNKALVNFTGEMVGGMIPNAACVFAGYGIKTYFCDVMNESSASDRIKADLEKYGLDVSHVISNKSLSDAKCIIVRAKGDRTILVVDGHKPEIELPGETKELFYQAAYIYSTPSELRNIKNVLEFMKEAKKSGAKFVLDIEASTFAKEDRSMLERSDVLFFNEYGMEKCRGVQEEKTFVKSLLKKGVGVITVTQGAKGSITYTKEKVVQAPAMKVAALDPTGAGDTFNSSFVRCLIEGYDIQAAARFANAAAGVSVTKLGPKGGVASVQEVEAVAKAYYG